VTGSITPPPGKKDPGLPGVRDRHPQPRRQLDHRVQRAEDVRGLVLDTAVIWIHGDFQGRPPTSLPSSQSGSTGPTASAQISAALNGPFPHFCGRMSWPPRANAHLPVRDVDRVEASTNRFISPVSRNGSPAPPRPG
jgi:hypothetical protein